MFSLSLFKIINILFDRPYYKIKLRSCGDKFRIGPCSQINRPGRISIGHNFFTGPFFYMSTSSRSDITIGSKVMVGPSVKILGGNHNIENIGVPMMDLHDNNLDKGITIEDDVWIGAGAIILDGSYISHGTVIAAGAVLNKKTEPFSIYGGVPARFIKYRTERV
jgi:acetyltransferase-like isoleucine patch superfamily enzyme